MRVTLLLPSLSRAGGGLFAAATALSRALAQGGVPHAVAGLRDAWTEADAPAWATLDRGAFPPTGPRAFGYSRALARFVLDTPCDVLHLHGLWQYPSIVCRRWSAGHPHAALVSPHGMLDPWALSQGRIRKRVAMALYQRETLASAGALHALTEAEARQIAAHSPGRPIFVVPNGVELPQPEPDAQPPPSWPAPLPPGCKVLLFLGRIHPKKGLDVLLHAWKAACDAMPARAAHWRLVVAGWDDGGHEPALRHLARELGLEPTVRFVGPLFGEDKRRAFRAAHAFVLPSLGEGLPMAVLEAWAHGLPALITPQCNLPEGFAGEAALAIEPTVEGTRRGLVHLLEMDERDRAAMGARARQLAAARFSREAAGAAMIALYRHLAGGGPCPPTRFASR